MRDFEIIDPLVRKKIRKVIALAEKLNYPIGVVGGFVRDLLLKRPSKDVDFVVIEGDIEKLTELVASELNAKKVKIHNQTLTTQIRFKDGIVFEFNSPRTEKYNCRSRVPEVQRGTIIDDLFRRDFTINALVLFGNKYVDIFNGTEDLENRIIRTTRAPSLVFEEDYLRIFRAIRFSCTLNFEIGNEVKKGIKENVHQLKEVAKERIVEEIKLTSKASLTCCFNLMNELGVLKILFPNLRNKEENKYIISSTFTKINEILAIIEKKEKIDYFLCFFALLLKESFHEKEDKLKLIKTELQKFKLSKKEMEKILLIVKYSYQLIERFSDTSSKKELRLLLRKIFDVKEEVIALAEAENSLLLNKNENLVALIKKLRRLSENKDLIFIDLSITGHDLINLGFRNEEIRDCKEQIIEAIMDEQIQNTKEEILGYIRKKIQ